MRCSENNASMKIRVATYNIHKGVTGGLRKRVRIHDVKLALHSMDADIVFLQEVQEKNDRMSQRNGYPRARSSISCAPAAICIARTE